MSSSYLLQEKRPEAQVRTEREILECAINWKRHIWKRNQPEDEKIEEFESICVRLSDGDISKGKALASKAIWSPGP